MSIFLPEKICCFDYSHGARQIEFVHERIQLSASPPEYHYTHKPHRQDYYELMFFFQGERDITVGKTTYHCIQGDTMIFNPDEPHFGFTPSDMEYDRYYVHIYPQAFSSFHDTSELLLKCFLLRPYCEKNKIRLPPETMDEARVLLEKADQSIQNRTDSASQLRCFTYIVQLLLLVNEHYQPPNGEEYMEKNSSLMMRILFYINYRYNDLPDINKILTEFAISRSGLWRLFRQYLNVSPYQYLQGRRMSFAKTLILSGSTVTQACAESGFGDCSRFIKQFKKTFGETPHKYYLSFKANKFELENTNANSN